MELMEKVDEEGKALIKAGSGGGEGRQSMKLKVK